MHVKGGPGPIPGTFWRPRRMQEIPAAVALVPAFGPAGAATFALSLEPGTRLTYGWVTEIFTSYSGVEQRVSWQAQPALRVDGPAFQIETGDRTMRAALMRSAASGATFLLALPMEEQLTIGVAVGAVLTISDTGVCDWAQPGQRAILVGSDGSSGAVVVQSTTATTITVDAIPAGVPSLGSRIMPVIPVVLDPQQGFTRHPVTVDLWDIRAKAVGYGWCGADVMGAGASVLTFDAGIVSADDLDDDSLIIWDRSNAIDGTGSETFASKADVVDLGGLAFSMGGSTVSDWIRPIKLRSTLTDDMQWLKAVARHLRGAQGMFLLSTGRPDLEFSSISGVHLLTVVGDYVSWFASQAHRRLAVETAEGFTLYVAVASVDDNGDGTNTLTLSDSVFGTVETISFLEQVRLESDVVSMDWDGGVMTCDLVAHVVQDTTTSEDIVTSAFSGHGLDGNIVFPVGNYDMDRDMFWEVGQLQSGSVVRTNGFVPRFRTALIGPFTGTAKIERNGDAAIGFEGGIGYPDIADDVNAGTIPGGSGSGGFGSTTIGGDAIPQADASWPDATRPGLGGSGGSGAHAGGVTVPPGILSPSSGSLDVLNAVRMSLQFVGGGAALMGGAGGGAGGGSGVATGGGGGAGAGNLVVCAGEYIFPENIIIQAKGGAGAAGVATNCCGGGGGGGGLIALTSGRLPFPTTLDNSGGAGGASGGGTGVAGSAGSAGAPPLLFVG